MQLKKGYGGLSVAHCRRGRPLLSTAETFDCNSDAHHMKHVDIMIGVGNPRVVSEELVRGGRRPYVCWVHLISSAASRSPPAHSCNTSRPDLVSVIFRFGNVLVYGAATGFSPAFWLTFWLLEFRSLTVPFSSPDDVRTR
jgi:hypothetical protein